MLGRCCRSRSAALAAGCVVIVAACARPAAAQPAADLCANAPVVGPGTYTGTTVGATTDGGTTCAFNSPAADVWYRVTPTSNVLALSLCGSAYDTVLSVHTGCPGTQANSIACNDQGCGDQSHLAVAVTPGQTYLVRISGFQTSTGPWVLTVSFESPPLSAGPDVVYSDIGDYLHAGPVGGVHGYFVGTSTCNVGDQNLLWTSGGTPGVGCNLYRLHDGRLEQIGMSWVKVATFAGAGPGCGLICNGQGGSLLGSGCRDTYDAAFNAFQSALKPRSQVNAWTGAFGPAFGTVADVTSRRLRVGTGDMLLSNFPGALYFVEGVYVAADESSPATKGNNASHRRVAINQTTFVMDEAPGAVMRVGVPAIQAWRDHGLGVDTPDPAVVIQQVDVPGEGRFWTAHKTRDNGDGTWRYEYAVFNLNSHASGGSFTVNFPPGVAASNIGFRDVDYHSGEVYDNTDWIVQSTPGQVRWRSPQTFEQNANSNALRWGTMYNFWFDADAAPADGEAVLGLFRPHTPGSVSFAAGVPGEPGCAADWNGDGAVNSGDISAFLTAWLASINEGNLGADFNRDLAVNSADISAFLSAWLDAVGGGC